MTGAICQGVPVDPTTPTWRLPTLRQPSLPRQPARPTCFRPTRSAKVLAPTPVVQIGGHPAPMTPQRWSVGIPQPGLDLLVRQDFWFEERRLERFQS